MAARKNKPLHDDKTKDTIRGASLVRMLTEVAEKGTYMGAEVSEKRISAAKTVLPFIRPALQSVEQTITDQRDNLSEEQLVAQLSALLSSKPQLLEKVLLTLDPTGLASTHTAPAAQQ